MSTTVESPSRAEAIAWLVMLIVAALSLLLFILVLLHFRSLLRSLDLILAGLLARNLFYSLVTAPTLISLRLSTSGSDGSWTLGTCRLLVFSLHLPLMVSLVGGAFFAVDRLFLLRKDGGPVYNGWVTNKVKPLLLISIWCCAAFITGLVPVNLWTRVTIDKNGKQRCLFLPSQLDYSYSMVLAACNLASAIICCVCCLDGLMFLRQSGASGGLGHPAAQEMAAAHVENGGGGVSKSQHPQQHHHEQHHEQQNSPVQPEHLRRSAEFDARKHAWEAWRVTSLANGIMFFCNHLPLLILDFATLIAMRDGSGSEYVTLVLVESILLPHSLWICAVRYRHVVRRYFAKLVRKPNLLDDRYCAMQMFQKRCTLMGSVYRGHKGRCNAASAAAFDGSSPTGTSGTGLSGTTNGRLVRIQDVGHVTPGLGGADNPAFSLSSLQRRPISAGQGSSSASANNDRLTQSTASSTATEWEMLQQRREQLHQQPISAGEQVRAVVHATSGLGALPEDRSGDDDEVGDSTEPDVGDRIDAVIVSTTEMATGGTAAAAGAAVESPSEMPRVVLPEDHHPSGNKDHHHQHHHYSYKDHRRRSSVIDDNDKDDDDDDENDEAFYLSEAELREIARQRGDGGRQLNTVEDVDDDEDFASSNLVAVTDYRRPRRPPASQAEGAGDGGGGGDDGGGGVSRGGLPFPRMYVNPLMRSVSGFSDDFGVDAASAADVARTAPPPRTRTANSSTDATVQGNNFSQELDSYL